MNKFINPGKRITIISKKVVNENGETLQEAGKVIRTVRMLADLWVSKGYFHYTAKKVFKRSSDVIRKR
jgi:hypothetical protein